MLIQRGKVEEGVQSLVKALELDPNLAAAHCNMGIDHIHSAFVVCKSGLVKLSSFQLIPLIFALGKNQWNQLKTGELNLLTPI